MSFFLALLFFASNYWGIDAISYTPPAVQATFQPQNPLSYNLGFGNIYTQGYCGSRYIQQSPINVDTTNFIKAIFPSPLTIRGFNSLPASVTYSNQAGNGKNILNFQHALKDIFTSVYKYYNFGPGDLVPTVTGGPLGVTNYTFKGCRIRFGLFDNRATEHAIDGEKGALETQITFVSPKGDITILSALYYSNVTGLDVLPELLDAIRYDGGSYTQTPYFHALDTVFPADGTPYAFYVGSDTQPPCAPNINWIISLQPVYITPQTVSKHDERCSVF